jgi:hypothetical protein
VRVFRLFEIISRWPMMCSSFAALADLLTRSQFAKYYSAMKQYYAHVQLYLRTTGAPSTFPPFSAFTDDSGWAGKGIDWFGCSLY